MDLKINKTDSITRDMVFSTTEKAVKSIKPKENKLEGNILSNVNIDTISAATIKNIVVAAVSADIYIPTSIKTTTTEQLENDSQVAQDLYHKISNSYLDNNMNLMTLIYLWLFQALIHQFSLIDKQQAIRNKYFVMLSGIMQNLCDNNCKLAYNGLEQAKIGASWAIAGAAFNGAFQLGNAGFQSFGTVRQHAVEGLQIKDLEQQQSHFLHRAETLEGLVQENGLEAIINHNNLPPEHEALIENLITSRNTLMLDVTKDIHGKKRSGVEIAASVVNDTKLAHSKIYNYVNKTEISAAEKASTKNSILTTKAIDELIGSHTAYQKLLKSEKFKLQTQGGAENDELVLSNFMREASADSTGKSQYNFSYNKDGEIGFLHKNADNDLFIVQVKEDNIEIINLKRNAAFASHYDKLINDPIMVLQQKQLLTKIDGCKDHLDYNFIEEHNSQLKDETVITIHETIKQAQNELVAKTYIDKLNTTAADAAVFKSELDRLASDRMQQRDLWHAGGGFMYGFGIISGGIGQGLSDQNRALGEFYSNLSRISNSSTESLTQSIQEIINTLTNDMRDVLAAILEGLKNAYQLMQQTSCATR